MMTDQPGIAEIRDFFSKGMAGRQAMTLADRRKAVDGLSSLAPLPEGLRVETVRLGGCAAERVSPPASQLGRAILYLHGGAFVAGSARSHRQVTFNLARETGLPVYALDYRLAPEHPFPAALLDVAAAYEALLEEVGEAKSLCLVGDSAGGNLVLSSLCRLRDRGLELPACAVAISPSTDLGCGGASYDSHRDRDFFLNKPGLQQDFAAYLGAVAASDPAASPLFADLGGLPPLLIQVGSEEILLDDSRNFIARLRAAGGDGTLEIWPGMVHVWHLFPHWVPAAKDALGHIAGFLARHMGHGP